LPDHVLQLLLLVHMERGSNSLTVSSRHRLRLHLAEPCTLCIAPRCAREESAARLYLRIWNTSIGQLKKQCIASAQRSSTSPPFSENSCGALRKSSSCSTRLCGTTR
jgi:hypothetical protein